MHFGALFTSPRFRSCFIQSLVSWWSCKIATQLRFDLGIVSHSSQHIRGSKNDAINLEGHNRYMSQLDNGVQILTPILTQNVTKLNVTHWLMTAKGEGPTSFSLFSVCQLLWRVRVRVETAWNSTVSWHKLESTTQTIKASHRDGI